MDISSGTLNTEEIMLKNWSLEQGTKHKVTWAKSGKPSQIKYTKVQSNTSTYSASRLTAAWKLWNLY